MPGDILIVDDEPAVRDAIAAILGDEGYDVRHAPDGPTALAEIESRPPALVLLDIWLEGSRLDGLAGARPDPADHRQSAGDRDQRPRHDRDRGHRDQEGRLRLPREAVQRRSSAGPDRARARGGQAQARERRAQAQARRRTRADRPLAGDPAGPDRDPAGRADRVAGADLGPARGRQGDRGAPDPRQLQAGRGAVRGDQRRDHGARAHGGRAVRLRGGLPRPRAAAPARHLRARPWRHLAARRGRRHAARDPGQDPARAAGAEFPPARRPAAGRGRCPRDRGQQPRPAGRDRGRALSRGPLLPAERRADPRAAVVRAARRHPDAGRLLHGAAPPRPPVCRPAGCRRRPSPCSSRPTGRATCASSATCSSGS